MKKRLLMTAPLVLLPLQAACGGDGAASTAIADLATTVTTQGVTTTVTAATAPVAGFGAWADRLMRDRVSPIVAASGDLTQVWQGADGKQARVVVRLPRTAGKPTVSIAVPANGADATPVFETAIARLKAQGGGILAVAPGEYRFKTLNRTERPGSGHILLNQASDIDVQAKGATFVLDQDDDGFYLQDCQRIRIQGATIRASRAMSGTGRIQAVPSGGYKLVLDKTLPDGLSINWVRPMNEGSHTWPYSRVRAIFNPATTAQPTRIDSRTFQSSAFNVLPDKQFVSVKFAYYGGRGVYIRDSDTGTNDDITLDGVKIGSVGGIGVLVYSHGRGFAMINSTIVADDGVPYSSNYDAFHVISAGGDILLRGNSFSNNGDDHVNIRSLIHKVSGVSGDNATLTNQSRIVRAGDEMAFFDVNGDYIGTRLVASVLSTSSADKRQFAFQPGIALSTAVYARDVQATPKRFAVYRNTFTDSSGRAILLQGADGLAEGNTIRVPSTAIKLMTSYEQYLEGGGAVNVRVTANTIQNGYAEQGFSYVLGSITAMAELVLNKLTVNPQNGPLRIDHNVFTSPKVPCVKIYATQNGTDEENRCSFT